MASDISLLTQTSAAHAVEGPGGTAIYWIVKRAFDVVVSLLALPVVAVVALILLVLNPFFNRGPVFYRQERMGRDQTPFTAVKFRTMVPVEAMTRGADDPVEVDRITPLGAILRKTRIDEFPQFLNILIGEMSVIGPRPDCVSHAREFLDMIPEYRARHAIRPGLSGLSQVTLGYVQGVEETRFKAQTDLAYIRNASALLDLKILWMTAVTIVSLQGQ